MQRRSTVAHEPNIQGELPLILYPFEQDTFEKIFITSNFLNTINNFLKALN